MQPTDLAFAPHALAREGHEPIHVRWLGTAGFEISHAGHTILIDPYITRASLGRCITSPLRSDLARVATHVPRADAVIAGHTHFDHALDVPAIAKATGAKVFGSRSCTALCRASGLPEAQVIDVERSMGQPTAEADVGPFHLRFLPSCHSKLLLGRIPFPGEITDCDHVPGRTEAYKCGAVFSVEIRVAGRTLVHLGSADLVEATVTTREADLLMLCVAGWKSSAHFPERLVRVLDPKAVLLSHWDDFFRPIEKPARVLPAIGFSSLAERLMAANRDLRVGTVPMLSGLSL